VQNPATDEGRVLAETNALAGMPGRQPPTKLERGDVAAVGQTRRAWCTTDRIAVNEHRARAPRSVANRVGRGERRGRARGEDEQPARLDIDFAADPPLPVTETSKVALLCGVDRSQDPFGVVGTSIADAEDARPSRRPRGLHRGVAPMVPA